MCGIVALAPGVTEIQRDGIAHRIDPAGKQVPAAKAQVQSSKRGNGSRVACDPLKPQAWVARRQLGWDYLSSRQPSAQPALASNCRAGGAPY